MILDELKLLIKDLEIILIKDSRFKKDIDFKNQVKTIYLCQDKSKPIEITGLFNLAMLNNPIKDITKKNDISSIKKELTDIKHQLDIPIPTIDLNELKQKINDVLERTNKLEGK